MIFSRTLVALLPSSRLPDVSHRPSQPRRRAFRNLHPPLTEIGICAGSTHFVQQLIVRYSLGTEYDVKDPATKQSATRNPFWHRAQSPAPGVTVPSIADLVDRGAVILVCDFAMGHLSKRLAKKSGRSPEEIHADLRNGLIQGAYAVPSGIFGLARAQNAGCAYVRM